MLICKLNIGRRLIAGPGHSPPNPHPIPKRAAPATNLTSIVLFDGILNFSARSGFFILY